MSTENLPSSLHPSHKVTSSEQMDQSLQKVLLLFSLFKKIKKNIWIIWGSKKRRQTTQAVYLDSHPGFSHTEKHRHRKNKQSWHWQMSLGLQKRKKKKLEKKQNFRKVDPTVTPPTIQQWLFLVLFPLNRNWHEETRGASPILFLLSTNCAQWGNIGACHVASGTELPPPFSFVQ